MVRIKEERENRYQQQLQDWEKAVKQWGAKGKEGKNPAKPRAFLTPEGIEQKVKKQLCDLPDSWEWCKVGHLFDVFVGSTPSRKNEDYWGGSIPWVSSGEVAFCNILNTEEKITELGLQNASTQIHPIDTVMLAMIGEGKTRGQASVLKIEACHNQNTAAIRVSETECNSQLFYYYLLYQYEITRKLGSGNNQKALNKSRVSEMLYPLIPAKEQERLTALLEKIISLIAKNEKEIENNLKKSQALRQSILKKAFSGKLVPQDLNDEPACELLKRIEKERC